MNDARICYLCLKKKRAQRPGRLEGFFFPTRRVGFIAEHLGIAGGRRIDRLYGSGFNDEDELVGRSHLLRKAALVE